MKVLITGGTHGMGLGVARALASRPDVEVIVLGRSAEPGGDMAGAWSSYVRCDLSRMADVRGAIATIRREHDSLDAVFVNAGLGYARERIVTEDGFDAHFQVNYLSHFMLTLNLLDLLEQSQHGGRVVFNVTEFGEIGWDDLQMEKSWSYEAAIFQAMAAKRLFYAHLHDQYAHSDRPKVSFFGFRIHKTVWTNQIAIIPWYMRAMATVAKVFGQFISIDECGSVMAPLFVEGRDASLERSGRLLTWKNGSFRDFDDVVPSDAAQRERLWRTSVELCNDAQTRQIAESLDSRKPR